MRGDRPFVFTNLKTGDGAAAVAAFVERAGGLGVGTQATKVRSAATAAVSRVAVHLDVCHSQAARSGIQGRQRRFGKTFIDTFVKQVKGS